MAAAPEKSQLQTASEIQWSDGTPFQGSLLLVLTLPTSGGTAYTKAFLKGTDVQQWRIPTRVKVPIEDGVLSPDVRVWQNADIEPPGTKWCGFWYDATGRSIAVDSPALATISADPHTITPPTLTVPTAAVACATESSLHYSVSNPALLAASTLVAETASGSGSSVTTSITPSAIVLVTLNGQVLTPTTDYTVAGNTITFVNVTVSSGDVRVVYYA